MREIKVCSVAANRPGRTRVKGGEGSPLPDRGPVIDWAFH